MTEEISEQEAGQQKQRSDPEAVAAAPQWRFPGVFVNGQAAVNYLNAPPAQGPGQMSATYNFADGRVALFVYF
jgi:hypothetical protein